jgi:spore coat polysaccharide biosynthesis protein SpsF
LKKVVATIEARMGSTRLPGKVLSDIGGIASLECQINRVRNSKFIDEIIIASTESHLDDAIEEFGKSVRCKVYRGSEEDILKRILSASESLNADIQVQLTGDCPLVDPEIIDELIEFILKNEEYDFVSNEIERTYPIGLDCRVFKVSALKKADVLCSDPIHRVHGSTYLYASENKHLFKSKNFKAPLSLHYPEWRWTLDTPEDHLFLEQIFIFFGEKILNVTSLEIAKFLNHNPNVLKLNRDIRQKSIEEG